MSNCPNCGSADITGAFCDHCGTRVHNLPVEAIDVSESVKPQAPTPPPVAPVQQNVPQDNFIDVPTHLAQSIVLTVLCCMPAGIVAIVYSAGASNAKGRGQYELASKKADVARTWLIVGWIVGILWWVFMLAIGSMDY